MEKDSTCLGGPIFLDEIKLVLKTFAKDKMLGLDGWIVGLVGLDPCLELSFPNKSLHY